MKSVEGGNPDIKIRHLKNAWKITKKKFQVINVDGKKLPTLSLLNVLLVPDIFKYRLTKLHLGKQIDSESASQLGSQGTLMKSHKKILWEPRWSINSCRFKGNCKLKTSSWSFLHLICIHSCSHSRNWKEVGGYR